MSTNPLLSPGSNESSDTGSPQERPGFRPDVEGLRAVAVLAVVLFHAGMPGAGGGFIGVDVFFVISGFLITGLLWRELSGTGTVRLGRFYGARARRLLPASAAVGVVTMIASAVLLPPLLATTVFGDGVASALYVSNIRFVIRTTDYFSSETTPSPFLHYWSLSVEEQFYLVWPALMIGAAWLARRTGQRAAAAASSRKPYLLVLALVGVVSFAASVALTQVLSLVAFFMMPTRAWQLAVGGLVALTAGQWHRLPARSAAIAGWAGLAVILLACNRLGVTTPYPGTAALWPVLGAALVIGAGCAAPGHGAGRALSVLPMRAIGQISYSWYLWHWPVLVLEPVLLGHSLGLAGRLAAVLFSGVLAVLTLRLIENPLRFSAAVRRSVVRSLAVGAVATLLSVSVGLALRTFMPPPVGRGSPAPTLRVTVEPLPAGAAADQYDAAVQGAFSQVQAAVAASADLRAVPLNLEPPLTGIAAEQEASRLNGCLRLFFESGQPECVTGDAASATRVALIGDSNAAMWNPAFQQIAVHRHWRLETLARQGCPLLDRPIIDPVLHRVYTECEQWRDQITARLRAERPRVIVLSMSRLYLADSGLPSYSPAWIDSLTRLLQQLRGTGAQVLVLGPIPELRTVVPVCVSDHLDDVTACSPPTLTAVNTPGIAAEAAAITAGGGRYADVTALFCATDRCPVIVGNTLVYFDNKHLTTEYARLLAPVMGALADRALAYG